jgi:hypothetical protein
LAAVPAALAAGAALRARPAGAAAVRVAAAEARPVRAAPKAAGADSAHTRVAETTGRVAARVTNVFGSLTGALKGRKR